MLFGILTKLACLTALIYVGLALVGQISLILFARFKGPIGIEYSRFGLGVVLGVAWFFAFNLAWWILRRNS